MISLPRLLDGALARLATVGADPDDDEETRLRKALLVLLAVLVMPVAFVWGTLYLLLGNAIGYVPFLYLGISVVAVLLFARNHDFRLLLWIELLDILLSTNLSMIPIGGFLGSGGVGVWGILAPLGALVLVGAGAGIRWYVAWLAVFLGSGTVGAILGIDPRLPVWFTTTMLALNISVGGTVVFTLLAMFARQREDALVALRSEHERAESLLLNILPGSIAERLKASPTTIADQFTEASVLFADVVDFTPRSQNLPPAEVVGLLDRLFGYFDTLAERYGLEKIKTIGDAYMVAAGVPTPRPDHARALAMLALDMNAALAPGGAMGDLGLEVRIGINSGPVVAGVIGRKRFLYDLWGDAVNTASRMESQGRPRHIQITRATYELLDGEFVCEPRGRIPVKGKGEMETWYLLGPRPGSPAPAEPASSAGHGGAGIEASRISHSPGTPFSANEPSGR